MKALVVPLSQRTRISIIVVAAIAMAWLTWQMNGAMAPAVDDSDFGIVDFELAGTPDQAVEILDDWGRDGREGAEQAIRIDFAYLVAYSLLLTLACASVAIILGERGWVRTARAGWRLAALSPLAGVLDGVENIALLRVLGGYESGTVIASATQVANVAASAKFAIVMVGFAFVIIAVVGLAATRTRGKRQTD